MVNNTRRADGLFQFIQRKLMGDDTLQVPFAACHNLLYVAYIFRHIASGADDALLGIGHVKKVDGTEFIVDSYGNKSTLNFTEPQEIIQDTLRTGGIQLAVNVGNCTIQGRSRAEIANG